MEQEEVQKALDQKFKDVQDTLKDLQENGASKDELQKAIDAVKTQGIELEKFIELQKEKQIQTFEAKFGVFLEENKEKIDQIYKAGSGEVIFNPFAEKAVEDITTESGQDVETPPLDRGTTLGSFDLRNDNSLLSLCTISRTSKPSAVYTEMIPKEGDYEFVAEGALKPKIDFRWENRYPTPKKVAAYEVLTEEAVTDYARLRSIAKEYLRKQHDLFKVDGVFFGSGVGEEPTGATVYGRTFVAGAMADRFENGTTNFMDKINAGITDIYTTQSFEDESHKKPNVTMISPIDFFIEFQAAKDDNGLPLYPQASLFNAVSIGGVTIRPWVKIPVGKVFIADMKKYNLVNYVPFSIRIGWINDQFIRNKFTMLGESRYFQYVKNLDQAAFIYDDIATIEAAIEAV